MAEGLPQWKLTQEEVGRADAMGLRIIVAVFLRVLIDGANDRAAMTAQIKTLIETVALTLPAFKAVPKVRQEEFRRCVLAAAHQTLENALSLAPKPVSDRAN